MSTFILIHGAAQGGWCWHKVKRILEHHGHTVHAPDLPGHSIPPDLPAREVTLERYVSFVQDAVGTCDEKVVLAGHSMGGAIITAAAEGIFERINRLVYVCAFVPRDNDTIAAMLDCGKSLQLQESFTRNDADMSVNLVPEKAAMVVYNGCDKTDIAFAAQQLVPQPILPFGSPIRIPQENYKKVKRTGIVCTHDRSLAPDFQEQMYAAGGCEIVRLASGHAPFFSKAEEVAGLLMAG